MASPILYTTFILLIISTIPQSFSQQNIQTIYPFSFSPPSPPPAVLPPLPPVNDDPPPPTSIAPPPSRTSTKAAVGKAIGATAASTLVLSGLLFFLLLRRSHRKRERENAAIPITTNHSPPGNNFMRFDGNLKGVIVDENGLDVLYWRNMEDGDRGGGFKKEYYQNMKDEQKEEQEKRKSPEIQEVPLLRGKSSTSQSPVWADNGDQMMTRAPTFSLRAEENRDSSSIQIVKFPKQTFPPPPLVSTAAVAKEKPAPAPSPPPPPPPVAVTAVPKAKSSASPPPPEKGGIAPPRPPSVPPRGSPAPSPPPPPSGGSSVPKPPAVPNKRSSSAGEGTSSQGNGQVKLKPLHWDKVNPNVEHSMVWDKIDKGSFKFDGDLMEALFGYVATNRKSPQRDNRSTSPSGDKSQIFILDTRKSQNTAIVLKSLGLGRKEIINALIQGQGLNFDAIEKLTRIAPTEEEASEILAFNGDPTRLADAESFLYHLLKSVPSAFARLDAMLFRSNYDSEVSNIKESLKSLESACNELRTRGLFLKLLEAVLKAGNRLNAGTSRGNAQAFNLTALRKLSDVKSSDGKTTLLQFVVQEVVRAEGKRCVLNRNSSLNRISSQSSYAVAQSSDMKDDREREYMMLGLPVIGGLSAEFANVKKAATLDYDVLAKTSSALSTRVAEIGKILEQCGSTEGGFGREMRGFLETAGLEMEVLREEQRRIMELVKGTTDYYQAGLYKDKGGNPFQLFVIVRDFLGMVDQVCVDIARNVQRRNKPVSSYVAESSSSDLPRVFRFPKLPPHFMSESSRSGSSGSDDESKELR